MKYVWLFDAYLYKRVILCSAHFDVFTLSKYNTKRFPCVNKSSPTFIEDLIGAEKSIFIQSRQVIEDYFNDDNKLPLNECKVIFLGDGGVGKSSIIERMKHGTFCEHSVPTNGISIQHWKPMGFDGSIRLT